MDKLDLLDRKILYELDLDSRQPLTKIAKKLKISKETASFRLKRLLSNSVISSFYTIFDVSKLGVYYFKIYLKLKNMPPQREAELISYIKGQKNISYFGRLDGYYDLVVVIVVKNPSDIVEFIYPLLERFGQNVHKKHVAIFVCCHRLNQRFLFPGEERTDRKFTITPSRYPLDENDLKIIRILTSNARVPIIEIAKKTGLDPSTVGYRIKKMQKDSVIIGYATALNYDYLGLEYIQINISLLDPAAKQKIISYFDSTDKCLFAFEAVGRYDLVIELLVKDRMDLRQIVNEFRKRFSESCNDFDVSTMMHEYVALWLPEF